MNNEAILSIQPMGFMLPVADPFLFCAHHLDLYPPGNDQMGPAASLEGRNLGQDFNLKDGWRMYHGETVPGFPGHPHRGFETVTIVLQGLVDHADSYGQAGRYGNGDVQWMTAGAGLQHSEMFPLLNRESGNTGELFQIWINLPREKKFAKPYFKMLWSEDIPRISATDSNGRKTEVTIIAGRLGETQALAPAPDSWAADPMNELGIWLIRMEAGAVWTLPAAGAHLNRSLYFYVGESMVIDGTSVKADNAVELKSDIALNLQNGNQEGYLLLLQGKPIKEPVEQYGPFVMNTRKEIQEAFEEFRRTDFGGWPWPRYDQVHPREKGRFATHVDGTEEVRD